MSEVALIESDSENCYCLSTQQSETHTFSNPKIDIFPFKGNISVFSVLALAEDNAYALIG